MGKLINDFRNIEYAITHAGYGKLNIRGVFEVYSKQYMEIQQANK